MRSVADKSRSLCLGTYVFLALLGNLAALTFLASIPSDSKSAVLFGYSAVRLVLLTFLATGFFLIGSTLTWLIISKERMNRAMMVVDQIVGGNIHRGIIYICVLILGGGIITFLMPPERLGDVIYIMDRLEPIIAWMAALSLQTLILLYIWRPDKKAKGVPSYWVWVLQKTLIISGFFLLLGGGMLWSRIGLDPDRSGWYSAGAPLLFSQVVLTCMAGIGFLIWETSIEHWLSRHKIELNLDLVISVLIWAAAGLVWWMEPMRKWSYFSSAPTPPNFEFYPYSDAAIYDEAAQGLLIGTSRSASVMLRPLYSFFLGVLHKIGGQDYQLIVLIQILVLASIPVLLYLIGLKLGCRAAGMVAAVLVVLREKNSIALTNVIEISHSKLLLSDTPAFALVLLFVLLLVAWLQRQDGRDAGGILAGAALGMVVLVRSHAQPLIPVVLICLIFVDRFMWSRILRKSILFLSGLILVITPWIWRNYRVSGNAAVENPEFYIRILASGYVHSQDEYETLPGEGFDEYYARMKDQILKFILDNPGEVARFYASHFIHNEISSVIYMPLTMKFYSLRSYVRELGFWADPAKIPTGGAAVLLWLNLGVISVGIASAYQRAKWVGLIPILIHIGYSLSVVPMRLSGGRFILPVDWVPLLYYSTGMMVLSMIIVSFFTEKVKSGKVDKFLGVYTSISGPQQGVRSGDRSYYFALVVSALFGLSLPFFEMVVPVRYPKLMPDEIVRQYISGEVLLSDGSRLQHSDLLTFLDTHQGSVALYGRALYPGFYQAGEYWGDANGFLNAASEYDRLQFRLIGPQPAQVFIPLHTPPESFPQASDVVVIGCSSGYGIRALVIQIQDQETLLAASPWHGLNCTTLE